MLAADLLQEVPPNDYPGMPTCVPFLSTSININHGLSERPSVQQQPLLKDMVG